MFILGHNIQESQNTIALEVLLWLNHWILWDLSPALCHVCISPKCIAIRTCMFVCILSPRGWKLGPPCGNVQRWWSIEVMKPLEDTFARPWLHSCGIPVSFWIPVSLYNESLPRVYPQSCHLPGESHQSQVEVSAKCSNLQNREVNKPLFIHKIPATSILLYSIKLINTATSDMVAQFS